MDYFLGLLSPKTSQNKVQEDQSSKKEDGKTCALSEVSEYKKWLTAPRELDDQRLDDFFEDQSSKKEDGKTCSLSEMSELEKWLTALSELDDQLVLLPNNSIENMNQESRQHTFIESEQKNLQLTENIANISSTDNPKGNTSTTSKFDTLFTPSHQGNSHGILSAFKHVPYNKDKEIGNYSIKSRIFESKDDDTEANSIKSNICSYIEKFMFNLQVENDVLNPTSIVTNSSDEYRAASDVSNRYAGFEYGLCMPESFEVTEEGFFSYHTEIPMSTGEAGNCGVSLGTCDDNLKSILRNDLEAHHVLLATETSNDRSSKLSNREEFLDPVNNDYVFAGPSGITYTVQCHPDYRLFICNECGKGFRQRGNLFSHFRTHTGEKPFACDDCKKRFRSSRTLAAHRRIHTEEKPFACDKCEKRFSKQGSLTSHIRTHTGEKPFPCDKCEKRFSLPGNLARHNLTHTGEKPFPCDKCKKRFSQASNLARHSRIHTRNKYFASDIRGKSYTRQKNLVKHRHFHME